MVEFLIKKPIAAFACNTNIQKNNLNKNCMKRFIYLALNLSNYENHLTKCKRHQSCASKRLP